MSTSSSIPALSIRDSSSYGDYSSYSDKESDSSDYYEEKSSGSSSDSSDSNTSSTPKPFGSEGPGRNYWRNQYTDESSSYRSGSGGRGQGSEGDRPPGRLTLADDPNLIIDFPGHDTHANNKKGRVKKLLDSSWKASFIQILRCHGSAFIAVLPSIIISVILGLLPYYDSEDTTKTVTFRYGWVNVPMALFLYASWLVVSGHVTNLWARGSGEREARLRSTVLTRVEGLEAEDKDDKYGDDGGRPIRNTAFTSGEPSLEDLQRMGLNQHASKSLAIPNAKRRRMTKIVYIISHVVVLFIIAASFIADIQFRSISFRNGMFFLRSFALVFGVVILAIVTRRYIPTISSLLFVLTYIILIAATIALGLITPIFRESLNATYQLIFRIVFWPIFVNGYRVFNRFLVRHAMLNNYGISEVLFLFPFWLDLILVLYGRLMLNSIEDRTFVLIAAAVSSFTQVAFSWIHIPLKKAWVTWRRGAEELDIFLTDVAYVRNMSRNIFSVFMSETIATFLAPALSMSFYSKRFLYDFNFAPILERDDSFWGDYIPTVLYAALISLVCNVIAHAMVLKVKWKQLASLVKFHFGYTFKRHNLIWWILIPLHAALGLMITFRTSPSNAFCEEDRYSTCCYPLAPRKFGFDDCQTYNATIHS